MEHQIGDASEMNPVLQELFKDHLLLSLGQLTKDEFWILMSQIATSNIARNQADGILMSQFATSNSEGSPTDSNLTSHIVISKFLAKKDSVRINKVKRI